MKEKELIIEYVNNIYYEPELIDDIYNNLKLDICMPPTGWTR